jgi:hypothetical protein
MYNYTTPYLPIMQNFLSRKPLNNSDLQRSVELGNVFNVPFQTKELTALQPASPLPFRVMTVSL